MSRGQLDRHREVWGRKPALARVYGAWFELMLADIPHAARVLEVGAGPGFFAEHARRSRPDLRWIAAELTPAPWNDVVADATRLPLRSGSCDAVVCLDVIHHLARPRSFFEEAARVLDGRGRVLALEPWITPLSYFVYRFLHPERCTLGVDPWAPFGAADRKDAFDGDAAVVWRAVKDSSAGDWRRLGLTAPRVRPLAGFAYLPTLGFRGPSLLPQRLVPLLLRLDAMLEWAAPVLGLRVYAAWDKVI